jgi:putative oxidoreductase
MSDASQKTLALHVVRLGVAGVLGAHGYARAVAGGVEPFGGFLDAKGFPAGLVLAWAITIFEMVGSLALATGRGVRIVAVGFLSILTMGILLVHVREGWFVVGLGRNGIELSVLLIVCLVALIVAAPRRAAG